MGIENVQGVRTDISEMLSKMREVSHKTKVFTPEANAAPTKSFDDVFSVAKGALGNVNQLQTTTEQLKTSYITGDSNVSISQVVLAAQKSKLAFEGLVSVRNKILEAYKEIMSMPV